MIRVHGMTADELAALEVLIRERHAAGCPDTEIGKELGVDRRTVCDWRRSMGLPSVLKTAIGDRRYREKVRRKTAEQIELHGVQSLAEVRVLAFRKFARDCGWPEDLRPRAVQILNVLWERGGMTRRQIADAIGMPWKGSRKSLVSNDPEGSYLAHLQARGLVIALYKKIPGGSQGKRKGSGGNVSLYMVSPAAVRGPFDPEVVKHGEQYCPSRRRTSDAGVDERTAVDDQLRRHSGDAGEDHQGPGGQGGEG